jgi:hypothetical protein
MTIIVTEQDIADLRSRILKLAIGMFLAGIVVGAVFMLVIR